MSRLLKFRDKYDKIEMAIAYLNDILNGSDRIGSDEIYDLTQVINLLKTIKIKEESNA